MKSALLASNWNYTLHLFCVFLFCSKVNVSLSLRTFKTGKYFMHMYLFPPNKDSLSGQHRKAYASGELTQLSIPKLEAFNLMGDKDSKPNNSSTEAMVPHWRSRVTLSVMTDDVSLDRYGVPAEIYQHIKSKIDERTGSFLPIALVDKLSYRERDLQVNLVSMRASW